MSNLLQIGCSKNIDALEYFTAIRLIYFKYEIDKEEERQNKANMRKR